MEHGRKKRDKTPLAPEKLKEQEELTARIGKQIQEFFSYRQDTSKLTDPLEYTSVMVKICPEIQTIYNLRKEIIQKRIESLPAKEKHAFLIKELQSLIPMMKQHPKSYCLWHHRKWCFIKGLEVEKEDPSIDKVLAKQELGLCEMQLAKDERNFHVWNYRSWIINTLKSMDQNVIDKELKFIDSKLQSNFSNFSALHFKSKNLLSKYTLFLQSLKSQKVAELQDPELISNVLLYGLPLSTIKEELETVKTGLYMQSSEQSMWLYHQWLIDRLIPIKVKCVRVLSREGQNLVLGVLLSQRVKGLSTKNIQILKSEDSLQDKIAGFTVEALTGRSYTDAYKITIPVENATSKLVLRLVNPDEILRENSEATLEEILSYCASTSFNNRLMSDSLVVVELGEGNKCIYFAKGGAGNREKELGALVEDQRKVIEEILELEPDNRFAHSELIYVIQRHEEPYANTPEAYGKRLELNEKIVKSSENLAKKNKGLVNRFTYFLNLYKLKSRMLESLKDGDLAKTREIEQSGEAKTLNLSELADLLLLSGVKITDNEVNVLLNVFN